MSEHKLISDFGKFERIYESVERGDSVSDAEINEGLLSGIMNFFSKVFGGRVTNIDKILKKYKKNELDYWPRWADANHEYNKAAVKRDTTDDKIEQREHLEMMERASKLIKQVSKTRGDVNDALARQAELIIRGNRRLRGYWEVKKAKVDEDVAEGSYTSLKKKVDEDTLTELYDRVKETQKKAKEKISKMPKGTMTIDFGDYADASKETKEMPFDKFGIHDVDDFIFANDELWNERIKLMPKENKDAVALRLKDAINTVKTDTDAEVKKYKKQIELAEEGSDARKQLEADLKKAETYGAEDIEVLTSRLNQLAGGEPKVEKTEDKPVVDSEAAKKIRDTKSKVASKLGSGVSEKEIDTIIDDMISLYDMIPPKDKDDEEKIRIVQLVDYSTDISKFKKDNKINGKVAGSQLTELYKEFKKEFPQ